jgi:hypothetical protein
MCDVLSKKMHRKKPKNSGTEMEGGGEATKNGLKYKPNREKMKGERVPM